MTRLGSPPLARGILDGAWKGLKTTGITPACAGNTIKKRHYPTALGDHPRLRGEYLSSMRGGYCQRGSPPLARGIRLLDLSEVNGQRITPACAGNTKDGLYIEHAGGDHPRLRGEYLEWQNTKLSNLGSPPLARGIPRLYIQARRCRRDHPRLRGEYSCQKFPNAR